MGFHDADGELKDSDFGINRDPYLYWLLPIVRRRMDDPESGILDYCRYHAGDSEWVRVPGSTIWTEPPKNW